VKDFLEKRKEVVLGLLFVVLLGVLWNTFSGGAVTGASGSPGLPGRAAHPDLAGMKLFQVDWEALAAPRPAYDPNGRNIFQFGVIPPPPPPELTPAEKAAIKKAQEEAAKERERQQKLMAEQQAAAQEKARQDAIEAASRPAPPPPPPPKPQPPAIIYKFIGYFGPPDQKIAVLHDGTDMLFVRKGDELPKGVKVLEIGYESIKFGFTDPQFRDESRTLPMSSSY
jgi:hypothetical protein